MSFKKLKTAFKLSVTVWGLIALPFLAPQQTHAAEATTLNAEYRPLIDKAIDDAARASFFMEGVSVTFVISDTANKDLGYTTEELAEFIREELAENGIAASQYFTFPSNEENSSVGFFAKAKPLMRPFNIVDAFENIPMVAEEAKKLYTLKEQPVEKPGIPPKVTMRELVLLDKRDKTAAVAGLLASNTYPDEITLTMYGGNRETYKNAVVAAKEARANGIPVVAIYLAKFVKEDGTEHEGVLVNYDGSTTSINEDGKVFLSSTKEKIAEEINFANTLRLEKEAKAEKDRLPLIP